jgi:excisionase family DNA binding protein
VGEPLVLSIDAALERIVAAAVRDALRAELGPLREQVAALAAATPPALVDVETAAARLGLSAATVRRQAVAGELPARRVGRAWRIDLAALRPATMDQVAELARKARGR